MTDRQPARRTADATLAVLYRNHKGEVATRRVLPSGIWYGETQWHSGPQWFLHALDMDREVWREFAVAGILAIGDRAATPADFALDPHALLDGCAYRDRHGMPAEGRDAAATVAALCRRLVAREADLAARDRREAELRLAYDRAFADFNQAVLEVRNLRADAGRMRAYLLALAREALEEKRTADAAGDGLAAGFAATRFGDIAEAAGTTPTELAEEIDA